MPLKTGVYIGRFQPFHEGHRKCVETILQSADRCVILIRDGAIDSSNPYDVTTRRLRIYRVLGPLSDRCEIINLPDPDYNLSVYIGRDVGYEVIRLDAETEAISATKLRAAATSWASDSDVVPFTPEEFGP